MVKLRVAARVIPEDEYLDSLSSATPAKSLRSEKRLLVIVRDPYTWQIGTLALEIQRAYKSCYQHDLATIKYLKDDEDDCDLDPQLYVSDLLLDEGRAQRDGHDQRVTIKVVLEQGRTLREGSVAIGGVLDNPEFRLQLQASSRPPVPKFTVVSSTLGKRQPSDYPEWALNGSKRQRHADILEPVREDSLMSSIEREYPTEHLDVVAATQSPPQHPQNTIKAESAEAWSTWRDIPAATVDELEALAEEPPGFSSLKKSNGTKARATHHQQPNGISSTHVETQPSHPKPNLPVTPVAELLKPSSASHPQPSTSFTTGVRGTLHSLSNSAGKFKRTVQNSIYDLPESDIDDSQMSPRSKTATLHRDKSRDRFSRIENLRSPSLERDHDQAFTINEAIDALDNESVFNDVALTEHDFRAQPPSLTDKAAAAAAAAATDHSSDDIYEDAESVAPETDPKQVQFRTDSKPVSQIDTHSTMTANNQVTVPTVPKHKLANAHDPALNGQTTANSDPQNSEPRKTETKTSRRRSRPSRSGDGSSRDGNSIISSPSSKTKSVTIADVDPQASRKNVSSQQHTRSTESLDEQLSQSLQQSAQKSLKKQSTGKKSGSETAMSTNSSVNKEGINSKGTTSKRGPNSKGDARPGPPSVTVNLAKEAVATSKPPKTPSARSSGPATKFQGEVSSSNPKSNRLAVDDRTEARKSPSVPIGLTEEEIKIMKSREGMTKEEYEADKRRKQLEQKHVDAAKKRESFGKPTKTKPVAPTPKSQSSASTSSKTTVPNSKSSKNITVELGAKDAGSKRSTTQDTENSKTKEPSQNSTLSSSPKDGLEKSTRDITTKTPAKSAPRNVSASKDRQTPKPSSGKLADTSKSQASTQKPNPTAAPPTIQQARSLKNLHAALKTAHENATSSANSSRNSSRPNQKKSILVVSDDDDTSDDDSSEDESSSDNKVSTKLSTDKLLQGTTSSSKVKPPVAKATSSPSSSSSSADSDEDAYERKQTAAAKLAKSALNRARSASLAAVSPSSTGEGLRNRRPDPSIRDASIELSDDSSEDDEHSKNDKL
ncbi:hypothetical protein PV10_02134 [Exophiala mesophila]|uniref:Nucleolar protein Dnt1-like N-terminal domain-containing protein n=1 Tax=Exophiala mesophila TaxID=212818 RepID=A0A0D1Y1D5_EXOME|nr:uncharacterized protein PV10_02134 [Exophiala mesophila]KIV94361.1 hypothetical protein PV10_02134 [Exophiala mesophila]